jgi:hypothetical protein
MAEELDNPPNGGSIERASDADAAPEKTSREGVEEPILGSVAQILNSRELVINRGTDHGVVTGMYFEVLAPEGEDVLDPDTGEVLGSVDRPKVAVRIVQVQPKLAVARTFRGRRRNIGGIGSTALFDNLFGPPEYVTEYDTFKTSERTWEDLPEEKSFVKIGDPVRQTHRYDDES